MAIITNVVIARHSFPQYTFPHHPTLLYSELVIYIYTYMRPEPGTFYQSSPKCSSNASLHNLPIISCTHYSTAWPSYDFKISKVKYINVYINISVTERVNYFLLYLFVRGITSVLTHMSIIMQPFAQSSPTSTPCTDSSVACQLYDIPLQWIVRLRYIKGEINLFKLCTCMHINQATESWFARVQNINMAH